jgi:hypothetical protein
MMAAGLTLEDIKRSFVFFKNGIDQVERGLGETLAGLSTELESRPFGSTHKRALQAEMELLRRRSEALVRDLSRLGSELTAQRAPAGELS